MRILVETIDATPTPLDTCANTVFSLRYTPASLITCRSTFLASKYSAAIFLGSLGMFLVVSERSACYLAAGSRWCPETGFSKSLPTGLGLYALSHARGFLLPLKAINIDYQKLAQAAKEIAAEYFDA